MLTAIVLDGLAYFPIYLISVLVVFYIIAACGWLLVRPFAGEWNDSLKLGIASMTGMLAMIILGNSLSFLISPPASLIIAASVACVTAAGVTFVSFGNWRKFHISTEWRTFTLLLLLLLGALFLVTYQQPNFDEDLHRPVVETLVHGNFPIRDPLMPFWFRQYDYHYGWQLLAATFSAVGRVAGAVSLDMVKYVGLLGGFSLVWGLLKAYKTTVIERSFAVISFFLSGPFWFFHDSFTQQYLFGVTQPFVGFSVFHNLQAVSWISLFVFLAGIIVIWSIMRYPARTRFEQVYAIIFLTLFLAGVALTGEFQFALILAIVAGVLVTVAVIRSVVNRRITLPALDVRLVIVACIAALFLAMTQGGVLTGVWNKGRILDPSYDAVVHTFAEAQVNQETVQQARVDTGIGGISDKPIISVRKVADIGFAPSDNQYIGFSEWRTILTAFGLFGIVFPIFIVITLIWLIRRAIRGELSYFDFIGATIILTAVLPMIAATRYGDQNLHRGWLLATGIFYALLALWVIRLRGNLSILAVKTGLIFLIIMTWLPVLAFNAGVFLFRPQIVQPSRSELLEAPRYYPPIGARLVAEKELFEQVENAGLTGFTLTLRNQGRYISEQTGVVTYSSLFLSEKEQVKYADLTRDLEPSRLEVLRVAYLYVSPELEAQLSESGKSHLAQYFAPVVTVDWQGSQYKLGFYKFNASGLSE